MPSTSRRTPCIQCQNRGVICESQDLCHDENRKRGPKVTRCKECERRKVACRSSSVAVDTTNFDSARSKVKKLVQDWRDSDRREERDEDEDGEGDQDGDQNGDEDEDARKGKEEWNMLGRRLIAVDKDLEIFSRINRWRGF